MAQIESGDRPFRDSPDAGSPSCLCSRCGRLIAEEDAPAIRLWDSAGNEWRYHRPCWRPVRRGDDRGGRVRRPGLQDREPRPAGGTT